MFLDFKAQFLSLGKKIKLENYKLIVFSFFDCFFCVCMYEYAKTMERDVMLKVSESEGKNSTSLLSVTAATPHRHVVTFFYTSAQQTELLLHLVEKSQTQRSRERGRAATVSHFEGERTSVRSQCLQDRSETGSSERED